MKTPIWITVIFAAMVLAQWIVPGSMIYDSQEIITKGVPLKFKCEPVDPNDPFRGKYITLDFDIRQFTVDSSQQFEQRSDVIAVLKNDSAGFAVIADIRKQPPEGDELYLKLPINYMSNMNKSTELYFDIPFTRFYMEEYKAPAAETLYQQGVADTTGNTYALVYVYKGNARIRDVMVRDTSVLKRLGVSGN
jgi:uncharacterized membrane-anchored protein